MNEAIYNKIDYFGFCPRNDKFNVIASRRRSNPKINIIKKTPQINTMPFNLKKLKRKFLLTT